MNLIRTSLLLVSVLIPSAVLAQGLGRGTPDVPVMEWPEADPVEMGLDTTVLARIDSVCATSRASACVVAYRGYLVHQWSDSLYQFNPFIKTRSATKALAGLLAGMLIDDGAIGGVEDPVSRYIPEWKAGADSSVTLRHLLTMTAGMKRRPAPGDPGVVAAHNTTAYVLGMPLDFSPGQRFTYSNETAQLLSPILERAAGMPLAAYARERLFDPIGASDIRMLVDEYGNTVTLADAEVTVRDFARIGQLVLNGGRWNGSEIVPEAWIEACGTPIPEFQYFGYQWWVDAERKVMMALGSFNNDLYVLRDRDLVAVRLQNLVLPGAPPYSVPDMLDLLRELAPTSDTDTP